MERCSMPWTLGSRNQHHKIQLLIHSDGSYTLKQNNKCWQQCGKTESCTHHWWEYKLVLPLCKKVLKKVWKFLRKFWIELYEPTLPTQKVKLILLRSHSGVKGSRQNSTFLPPHNPSLCLGKRGFCSHQNTDAVSLRFSMLHWKTEPYLSTVSDQHSNLQLFSYPKEWNI